VRRGGDIREEWSRLDDQGMVRKSFHTRDPLWPVVTSMAEPKEGKEDNQALIRFATEGGEGWGLGTLRYCRIGKASILGEST